MIVQPMPVDVAQRPGCVAVGRCVGAEGDTRGMPADLTPDPDGGARVLAWLASAEGRAFAGRWAHRRGLDAAVVEDLVADAQVAVLGRMRTGALRVDNPAAYGTQVLKSVVRATLQGRSRDRAIVDAVGGDLVAVDASGDPTGRLDSDLDDLRVVLDVMSDPARPWLTGAALAFVTLTESAGDLPDGVPRPRAGATPTQARGWAALWFAGVRDMFPGPAGDPSAQRRRRGRSVDRVLEHLRVAADRSRLPRRGVTDA